MKKVSAADRSRRCKRVKRRFPFHTGRPALQHVEVDTKEESNAAVICIMDTSGSMDTMKKYPRAELLLPALPVHFDAVPATSRSFSSDIILKRPRSPRKSFSTRANRAARSYRRATPRRSRSSPRAIIRRSGTCMRSIARTVTTSDSGQSGRRSNRPRNSPAFATCIGYGEIKPLGSRYYESSMLTYFVASRHPIIHTRFESSARKTSGRRSKRFWPRTG